MGNVSSRGLAQSAQPNSPNGSAPAEEQPVVTGSSTSIDSSAPTDALALSGTKEPAPAFSKPGQINMPSQSLDQLAADLCTTQEARAPSHIKPTAVSVPSNDRPSRRHEEIQAILHETRPMQHHFFIFVHSKIGSGHALLRNPVREQNGHNGVFAVRTELTHGSSLQAMAVAVLRREGIKVTKLMVSRVKDASLKMAPKPTNDGSFVWAFHLDTHEGMSAIPYDEMLPALAGSRFESLIPVVRHAVLGATSSWDLEPLLMKPSTISSAKPFYETPSPKPPGLRLRLKPPDISSAKPSTSSPKPSTTVPKPSDPSSV